MDLLPISLGTRPRLAVEVRTEGVVAARSEDAQALVSAVSYSTWPAGTVSPSVRPGNVGGRKQAVAAVKKALETVALKERQTTLVLPDAAVRVLLLDFDTLPTKAAEALPVVRFRLKKLLPFDADKAIVSYQIMSQTRNLVRVLALAVPQDVLGEYESLVREAGFEPGAVLPSTLAACAGLAEMEAAALLVNVSEAGVTTAIVQGGVLLLHRSVDLAQEGLPEPAAEAAAPLEVPAELLAPLPLVSVEDTAGEWAKQEPVSGYGVLDEHDLVSQSMRVEADLQAKRRADLIIADAMLAVPDPVGELEAEYAEDRMTAAAREVMQAVSVAAAYYEDTLEAAPGIVLSAGTLGAETLGQLLREAGITEGEIRVREMVEPVMLAGGAVTARVPHGWLAGVRGALRS